MEVACTAKRNFDRECKKTFATKSALSVISLLRSDSVAFGCEADMRTVDRSNQSDVNDPTQTSASISSCSSEVGFSLYQSTSLNRYDAVSSPYGRTCGADWLAVHCD